MPCDACRVAALHSRARPVSVPSLGTCSPNSYQILKKTGVLDSKSTRRDFKNGRRRQRATEGASAHDHARLRRRDYATPLTGSPPNTAATAAVPFSVSTRVYEDARVARLHASASGQDRPHSAKPRSKPRSVLTTPLSTVGFPGGPVGGRAEPRLSQPAVHAATRACGQPAR